MSIAVDLRSYFTPEAVARQLENLPPVKTPVMDTVFTDRPQHPLPVLGVDDISETVQTVPVVKRGAPSTPVAVESREITYIEPMPVKPSTLLTAVELNNFKLLDGAGREAWTARKIDSLRRVARRTTEVLAAQAMTGKISFPLTRGGGAYDTYEVDFGTPLSHTPGTLWDNTSAKITDVFKTLTEMQLAVQQEGFGGRMEVWAGKDAYYALMALAEKVTSTAKVRVEMSAEGVFVGNFLVKLRTETYKNPQTGVLTNIVPDHRAVMVGLEAEWRLFYCAVDDLEANLLPMPFFVKPVELSDPSGIKLVGESKPLPVPNMKAVCWADVVAE